MIILDSINKSLELILASAVATNQLPIIVSYIEMPAYTPVNADSISNDGIAVTITSAPAGTFQRQIKLITIYNADTTNAIVTIRLNNSGTFRILVKIVLASGSTLVYTDGEGFRVITSAGAIVDTGTTGPIGLQGSTGALGLPGLDAEEPEYPYIIPGPRGTSGSATAAGSDTQVQFNDAGSLGADSDFTWNKTTNQLLISLLNLLGGQILFPATQNPSSNANTLDDYEEGTINTAWTPSDLSGAGLSFSNIVASAIKIGQLVIASARFDYPATASGADSNIGGLPWTSQSSSNNLFSSTIGGSTTEVTLTRVTVGAGGTNLLPYNSSGVRITNLTLSGDTVQFTAIYMASA